MTSVMRLREMSGPGGKDKASWHGGRVYLNKEVNLEIQRQNNGEPLYAREEGCWLDKSFLFLTTELILFNLFICHTLTLCGDLGPSK